jgi:putative spermidine/putrescine transport system permease protein
VTLVNDPAAPPALTSEGEAAPQLRRRALVSGDRLWQACFVALATVIMVFLVAPLVVVVATSFGNQIEFPPPTFNVQAYRDIPGFMFDAFFTSLKVGALSTGVAMLLAFPTTLALVRGKLRGRAVLMAYFQSPLQIPAIVQGLALFQLYISVDAFRELRGSLLGLVIGHVMLIFPFVLTTMVGRISSLDLNLELAAYGLGAGFMRTTWYVTLPLMRPAIIAGGFLAFLISFDDTALSLFLVSSSQSTLPLTLFNSSEQALSPAIYAMSTLVIGFSFVLAVLVDRLFGLRTVMGGT